MLFVIPFVLIDSVSQGNFSSVGRKATKLVSSFVLIPEPGQIELLDGALVAGRSVAYGPSAHEMANLFGDVLGMIASALQRLRHKQDVDAVGPCAIGLVFEMPEEDQITNSVDLAIRSQDGNGAT